MTTDTGRMADATGLGSAEAPASSAAALPGAIPCAECAGVFRVLDESHRWLYNEKRRLEASLRRIAELGTPGAHRTIARAALPRPEVK